MRIPILPTLYLLPHLVLRLTPNDADVIQTKLFLLLQTDQYARAFEIVESISSGAGPSKSSKELEKAYLLYRLHKENEAREIVDQVKEKEGVSNGRCAHLEAQIVPHCCRSLSDFLLGNSLHARCASGAPPNVSSFSLVLSFSLSSIFPFPFYASRR